MRSLGGGSSESIDHRPQDAGERAVRGARCSQIEAAPDMHVRRTGELALELPDQTGLADPGFALDEHGGRFAARGAVECVPQFGEVGMATHHCGADRRNGHHFMVPRTSDIGTGEQSRHRA
jgi:hypothetical protein